MRPPALRSFLGGGADEDDAADRRASARVSEVRAMSIARQGTVNAGLRGRALAEVVTLDESRLEHLVEAVEALGLSARAFDRIRRVARTIADLEQAAEVGTTHLDEALSYRVLDRT
jgi:magnesium chelatase family protein